MTNLDDMDIPAILKAVASFLGTRSSCGYDIVINGCRVYPSASISDAMLLASKFGLTISFSNINSTVTVSHGLLASVTAANSNCLDKPLIAAILSECYAISVFNRRD